MKSGPGFAPGPLCVYPGGAAGLDGDRADPAGPASAPTALRQPASMIPFNVSLGRMAALTTSQWGR